MQREYVSCSSLDFFPPKRLFSIQKKIDILYNNRQLLWRARIFIISIYQVVWANEEDMKLRLCLWLGLLALDLESQAAAGSFSGLSLRSCLLFAARAQPAWGQGQRLLQEGCVCVFLVYLDLLSFSISASQSHFCGSTDSLEIQLRSCLLPPQLEVVLSPCTTLMLFMPSSHVHLLWSYPDTCFLSVFETLAAFMCLFSAATPHTVPCARVHTCVLAEWIHETISQTWAQRVLFPPSAVEMSLTYCAQLVEQPLTTAD